MNKSFLLQCLCSAVFLVFLSCSSNKEAVPPSTPPVSPNTDAGQADPTMFSAVQLMTAQDILNQSHSNISLTNGLATSVTASGLYVVSYDVNDCSACTGTVLFSNNALGAMATSTTFAANQTVKIGQNYLYNLLYNGMYAITANMGVTCQLPGCSWPGDNPGVTGWCITIGVMSRHSAYTSSSYVNGSNAAVNAVPYGQTVTNVGLGYKYDLIDPSTLGAGAACLGPIVCNDQTLTCSASTSQSQTIQAY